MRRARGERRGREDREPRVVRIGQEECLALDPAGCPLVAEEARLLWLTGLCRLLTGVGAGGGRPGPVEGGGGAHAGPLGPGSLGRNGRAGAFTECRGEKIRLTWKGNVPGCV